MEKEIYFKKWAKETGKTQEEIEEIWKGTEEKMRRLGLGEDERAIQGAFRRRLRGTIYGKLEKTKPTEEFHGFVFGTSRLIDWDEVRRMKALREYSKDPQEAILVGLVDEAGNPLDDRAYTYQFGRKVDNPNFRKPLVGHSYERKVFGLAVREGDREPKVFRLNLRGRTAKEFTNYQPFTPVRFLAKCYGDNTFYELYPIRVTKFSTQKTEKIDCEKWMRTNSHIYTLDKLEQAYTNSRDAVDKWTFLEADLDYIHPEIDEERQQRTLNLTDEKLGLQVIRARIPVDFPIGFSEFSRLIVMGEVQRFNRKDGTEAYIIEGYGAYALPGKTVKPPERDSHPAEGEEREESIILWE